MTTLAATSLACGLVALGCRGGATSAATAPPATPGAAMTPPAEMDEPPRAVRIKRPRYPQEAYDRQIEGVVELEIVIDETGRVSKAKVVKSVPELDTAAIQCVKEWVFQPARKAGRPVAILAMAPVTFRIR